MKKKNLFIILVILSLFFSARCYGEENSIYDEGIKNLQQYLTIDTTNPPGNEMETALFLKKILDKEGIENQIFDIGNNRANIVAILKGDGSKKAIILNHHMDVVPAEEKYWKISPFSGQIIDGEIYGRGAVDIKSKGIIDLMTLINLKRMNVPLKRDIIFLAVADEEQGSTGAKWMVENKSDLLKKAEFFIDEGECIATENKEEYYFTAIGEKSPLWLTITFTGKPGHGSIPDSNSSVNHAIRAADKILNYDMEFTVIPEVKDYVKILLKDRDIRKIPGYKEDFDESLKSITFLKEISKDSEINASIRNTISITMLKGSDKINTIPNEASISLDCRLLPEVDKDEFIEKLKKIINDDTATIKIEEFSQGTFSPGNSDFTKALKICAEKRNPEAMVVNSILLSSTDSCFYRPLGIYAYGFEPYKLSEEEYDLAHGNNERMRVENIKFGIDLLTDLMMEMNK